MQKKYKLVYKKEAIRYLEKLPVDIQDRIFHYLDRLAFGFHESLDIKMMIPKDAGIMRLRIGKLRVLFELESDTCRILAIGPRGDVYK